MLASVDATNKITLVAGVTADQTGKVKAGELVGNVAGQVGGKGGGRPDFAQAGGNNPAALGAALAKRRSFRARQARRVSAGTPYEDDRPEIRRHLGGLGRAHPARRRKSRGGSRIAATASPSWSRQWATPRIGSSISPPASRANPNAREMDVLLSTGEQVSIALLAMALCERGVPARSFTGSQIRVRTTNVHRRARITDVETKRLRETMDAGIVPVVAGFQGIDDEGDITTIGRGGSDTSAVALAVALKADECQILTDVDGVYTTDPRMVPEARLLSRISFEEMLELAGQGSRVLHLRSVEFAAKYNVPLRVLSSFRPGSGTLICKEESQVEAPLISGIAFNRDEAQLDDFRSARHRRTPWRAFSSRFPSPTSKWT